MSNQPTPNKDYALLADTVGDMLVMRVAHRLTGDVIYEKRKRIINEAHLRSELYTFREYMLKRNGLNQAILDNLCKKHDIDPTGKGLRTILDELKEQQDQKGYFDITRDDVEEIKAEVSNGKELRGLLKKRKLIREPKGTVLKFKRRR